MLTIERIEHVQAKNLSRLNAELAQIVIKRVTDAVEGAGTYPLFDDPTGLMIQLGILRGELKPSERGAHRSKQLGLASTVLRELPHFDLASMDEILDIRRELERPLLRFRAAITDMSEGILPAVWEPDFINEVDDVFQPKIRPLVLDLEEEIRSNSYMRALVSKFASDPAKLAAVGVPPALSLLAAGSTGILWRVTVADEDTFDGSLGIKNFTGAILSIHS